MTRVLHIISQYPDRTGSGIYLRSLIKEFRRRAYRQSVLYAINSDDFLEIEGLDIESQYRVEFKSGGLPFPVVGMSDNMPYESTKYSDMDREMVDKVIDVFKKKIKKAIEDFRPDTIYSHHLWLTTAIGHEIAGDIPVVAFSHGTDIRQLRKDFLEEDYILKNIRNLEKIYALTDYQRKEITKAYGIKDKRKIEVIGAGFDSDIFFIETEDQELQTDNMLKLVYAGKICKTKGVDFLVRAYRKVKIKSKLDIKLIIIGNGVDKVQIQAEARKVNGDIEFIDSLSQANLAEIFRQSDIFILPSFYEGLALVNMEALASGMRVISNDLPGLKDYMGESINRSGLIEYVDMPRASQAEYIGGQDLSDYEERLVNAIESQILKRDKKKDRSLYKTIYSHVSERSWKEIFKKI